MSRKKLLLVSHFYGPLGNWINSRFAEAFREEARGEGWDVLTWEEPQENLHLLGEVQGVAVILGEMGERGGMILGYALAREVPAVLVDLQGGRGASSLKAMGLPVVSVEALDPRGWRKAAGGVLDLLDPGGRASSYPGLVRHGLDIRPPRGFREICQVFGNIEDYIGEDGTLSPAWEEEKLALAPLPFSIPLSWAPDQRVKRIRCHRLLVPVFEAVFREVVDRGLKPLIRTYGGCFSFRRMRGGSRLSTHSWGIVIDINPDTNPLGSPGDMAPELVGLFQEFGFTWGGRFSRPDPMHFQFCSGY